MTASLSNLFGYISFTQTLNLVLTKIFEKEAVWAIISTMLDDVGPTMLDPFKQSLRPKSPNKIKRLPDSD